MPRGVVPEARVRDAAAPPEPPTHSAGKETTMETATLSRDVITSDRVEGTSVYNRAGDKLGSIDHLVIDKLSGQVRYAVLEFGGFLGIGTDRYPIPWNMLKYDTSQDGYVVPLDKATLENAPRYSGDARPDYDEDYGRRVYSYYGANW
jgi:sporulation protein YlmC with PRC-barrel domain